MTILKKIRPGLYELNRETSPKYRIERRTENTSEGAITYWVWYPDVINKQLRLQHHHTKRDALISLLERINS